MRATGADAFANGLAIVFNDIRGDRQMFNFQDEFIRLPRGAVRVAQWNGLLVSLIGDVREAAARAA